ncbi:MAG: hypothetical protein HQK50_03885 [Oligoflexia bacterium]|nr:hypothetical protein [Oligoflexia bacterium]MBF0364684.1 hypothetical protein [Oligoflexia bacterium]
MKKHHPDTTENKTYCLLLAAGLGERMGEIGKFLPKPLWPVFDKTLLEMQINYALDLNSNFKIDHLFINTHKNHQQIHQFLLEKQLLSNVTLLHEPELLDIGGAIHNLAARPSINYDGNLLVINSDQFLFFDFSTLKNALLELSLKLTPVILFGIDVDTHLGHNELQLKNQCYLSAIRKNSEIPRSTKSILTYSGMSLIKLNALAPVSGKSPFFTSVANYLDKNILIKTISNSEAEYWDFGTLPRYYHSVCKLFDLLTKKNCSIFVNFLKNHHCFTPSKLSAALSSYGLTDNTTPHLLNFSAYPCAIADKGPSGTGNHFRIILQQACADDASTVIDHHQGLYYRKIKTAIPY